MSDNNVRLPTFLIIGAMKAGTTSLFHYLREHPQIFMPKIKEVDFFTGTTNWGRGMGWYERQFAAATSDYVAIGEASTAYTKYPHFPGVPDRIVEHLPDVKLVYVIRHPIDRIRSHYQHRVAVGAETKPLEQAVLDNPIYVDYSKYAMQAERYLRLFREDHLLLVTSEALRDDRHATVRHVYAFLGVNPEFVPTTLGREFYKTRGRSTYPSELWRFRRALRRAFPAAKRAKELVDSIGVRMRAEPALGNAEGADPSGSAPRPEIPPAVRAVLEDRLGPDVRKLRTYLPPVFDGWGIA